MEQNQFSNFNRRSPKEHFCEIILKSGHWPRRTYHLKVFLCFSFGGHYVERSGTILTILVEEHPRNISVKGFFFHIFCSGGHFVLRSGTILTILIEGHPRNISINYFA